MFGCSPFLPQCQLRGLGLLISGTVLTASRGFRKLNGNEGPFRRFLSKFCKLSVGWATYYISRVASR